MEKNQEKYSRRTCKVIKGREVHDKDISEKNDQETILKIQIETNVRKDTMQEKIDKMHPLSKSKQGK